ncbi:MAG: hypothetical protein KF886_26825 [Candidatus Hydrogenedentes bacterium]|nr:hypothetical protein [Candidatus Hydrogenedentota bacterium]
MAQRSILQSILLLLVGLVLVALPFASACHHHNEDPAKPCWFCVTVAVALLPWAAAFFVTAPALVSRLERFTPAPRRRSWSACRRRGPPFAFSTG